MRKHHGITLLTFMVLTFILSAACTSGASLAATGTPFLATHAASHEQQGTTGQTTQNLFVVKQNGTTLTVEELQASNGSPIWSKTLSGLQNSEGIDLVGGTDAIYAASIIQGASLVYALAAQDGHMLWQKQTGQINAFVTNGADLYLATTDAGSTHATYFAWRASDGKELWHYTTTYAGLDLAVNNSAAYISINQDVVALQLTDGNILWQQTLGSIPGPDGIQANNTEVFAVTTSKTEGSVYALDALNGKRLWQYTNKNSGLTFALPYTANNDVYIQPFSGSPCALQETSGSLLWCNPLNLVSAANGVIYVQRIQSSTPTDTFFVCALQASNAKPLWCTQVDEHASIVATGNIVYTRTTTSLYELQTSNGQIVWHLSSFWNGQCCSAITVLS